MNLWKYVTDVPAMKTTPSTLCDACEKGKAHRLPHNSNFQDCRESGENVYSDVAGPYKPGRNEKNIL